MEKKKWIKIYKKWYWGLWDKVIFERRSDCEREMRNFIDWIVGRERLIIEGEVIIVYLERGMRRNFLNIFERDGIMVEGYWN